MPWIHGRLSWTLLVSILAHAGVLLSWPGSVASVPEALSVTLVQKTSPSHGVPVTSGDGLATRAPPSAPKRRTAAAPSVAASSMPAAPEGEQGGAVAVAPALLPLPAPPVAGRAPVAGPALAVTDGAAPSVAQAVAEGVPQAPPAAGSPSRAGGSGEVAAGGAASVDDLRQYRGTLAGRARHLKRYPLLARERGWQGTVEVEVRDHGSMPLFRVWRSSGHALLDQQALDLLAQAARLVVVPESLRRTGFRFVVPVEYRLDE